jgi:hypothetical protein
MTLVPKSWFGALTFRTMRMPRLRKHWQLSHRHALREWLPALKEHSLAGLPAIGGTLA